MWNESGTGHLPKKPPKKKQIANRARHRLRSIDRDCSTCLASLREEPFVSHNLGSKAADWPLLANERCGTWYVPPTTASTDGRSGCSCYFKSTDGHCETWNFSFKRLNLSLVDRLAEHGGCFLVDSSVRKVLPDSFARTIPIWACVLNRIVVRYRMEFEETEPDFWDTRLYTPHSLVSSQEHDAISALLDQHVDTLYQSKAIVNPKHLIQCLKKPIRPIWATNGGTEWLEPGSEDDDRVRDAYLWVVCVNPSTYNFGPTGKNQVLWIEQGGYYYVSGAADDQESWARQLTPELFWKHHDELKAPDLSDDQVDERIDRIVSATKALHSSAAVGDVTSSEPINEGSADQIGSLLLWIGSRRKGRPPECWERFDAVLNVTDQEYEGMDQCHLNGHFYLQMPVAEGKKDRTELERWMPVGLHFLIEHLRRGRRVLVHCNQGKDRSVALVLALVVIACPLTFPLALHPEFGSWDVNAIYRPDCTSDKLYKSSGIPSEIILTYLAENGKEQFLSWVHCQSKVPLDEPLADKDRLRIALHLLRQDRKEADPSRFTMQKLNRFFMSSPMYRSRSQETST